MRYMFTSAIVKILTNIRWICICPGQFWRNPVAWSLVKKTGISCKTVSSTDGSESENKVKHTLINIIIEYVRVNAKYCLYTAVSKCFHVDLSIAKPNKPEGRGALYVVEEDLRKCTRKSRQEKNHYLTFRTNWNQSCWDNAFRDNSYKFSKCRAQICLVVL